MNELAMWAPTIFTLFAVAGMIIWQEFHYLGKRVKYLEERLNEYDKRFWEGKSELRNLVYEARREFREDVSRLKA